METEHMVSAVCHDCSPGRKQVLGTNVWSLPCLGKQTSWWLWDSACSLLSLFLTTTYVPHHSTHWVSKSKQIGLFIGSSGVVWEGKGVRVEGSGYTQIRTPQLISQLTQPVLWLPLQPWPPDSTVLSPGVLWSLLILRFILCSGQKKVNKLVSLGILW